MDINVEKYLGTTKQEVEAKKFNICIGISLGNKYFTKEHIEKFIKWALEYARESILVLIADEIHAINVEMFDKRSKLAAHRRAFKMADEKEKTIGEIVRNLPPEQRKKIHLAHWRDVRASKYHNYRKIIIYEEFQKRGDFYKYIIDIVKENLKLKGKDLSDQQVEKLASYVLDEIPVFLNGVKFKSADGWKTYTLIPYPGLGKLDYFIINLQQNKTFPELVKKLKITDKIAILEAYAD